MSPIHPSATITYKTDPIDIVFDIFSPANSPESRPGPLIVYFHVGALLYGDRSLWTPQWMIQKCQEEGWTFISADYRLIPESRIDDTLQDVQDLWTYIHTHLNTELSKLEKPLVDLENLFVAGGSAGGYLTLQAGHLLKPRPRALASYYGYIFSSASWFRTAQSADVPIGGIPCSHALSKAAEIQQIFDNAKTSLALSGVPATADGLSIRELMYHHVMLRGTYFSTVFGISSISTSHARYFPQLNIDSSYPPTFLFHGTADSAIPYTESQEVAEVLQKHGVDHKLVILEGKEHLADQSDEGEDINLLQRDAWEFFKGRAFKSA